MADAKVPALTELNATPADADELYIVDKSDTTDDATGTSKKITRTNLVGGLQAEPSEGAFVDGDKTKLDSIEASADVTDATNVAAAGAIIPTGTPDGTKFLRDDGVWTAVGGGGDLLAANNLSDVANAATSLSNLGGIGAATTDTLTNKTFDANGTGNSLSNVDVADLANGTDGELITWDAAGAPATVATGTSGHVLTSNGAGAAPTFQAAAGGSGGNPFGANVVIAASGGDYTTLDGYAGNDADGDIVYIQDSHTLGADATITANNVHIYQAPNTVITMGTYFINLATGTGVHVHRLETTATTGDLFYSQAFGTYENIDHTATSTGSRVIFGADDTTINKVKMDISASDTDEVLQILGDRVNADMFRLDIPMRRTSTGSFKIEGNDVNVSRIQWHAGTNTAANGNALAIVNGARVNVANSSFSESGTNVSFIHSDSDHTSVTNCSFNGGLYPIEVDDTEYGTYTSNTIESNGTYGFFLNGAQCRHNTIGNNTIQGSLTAGIRANAADLNTIGDNAIDVSGTAILIEAGSDNNIVMGNQTNDSTTKITDSGTGTLYQTATDSDALNKV